MMAKRDVEAATREELADELAAACEYTDDWESATMDDLRERVRDLLDRYEREAQRIRNASIRRIRKRTTISDVTGFENGEKFVSRDDVWQYFTVENMNEMWGQHGHDMTQDELNVMRDAVWEHGWHCAWADDDSEGEVRERTMMAEFATRCAICDAYGIETTTRAADNGMADGWVEIDHDPDRDGPSKITVYACPSCAREITHTAKADDDDDDDDEDVA